MQNDKEAIRVARSILRKDREFLDARCALTAFLWASGDAAGAEAEWTQLQNAQGMHEPDECGQRNSQCMQWLLHKKRIN